MWTWTSSRNGELMTREQPYPCDGLVVPMLPLTTLELFNQFQLSSNPRKHNISTFLKIKYKKNPNKQKFSDAV